MSLLICTAGLDPGDAAPLFAPGDERAIALAVAAARNPLCGLVARRDGGVTAALAGAFIAHGYRICELHLTPGAEADAGALVDHLRAQLPGQRLEAVTRVRGDGAVERLLAERGLAVVEERVHYTRDLGDVGDDRGVEARGAFEHRPAGDVGRAGLLAALERIIPDVELARLGSTVAERLEELLDRASSTGGLDVSSWTVAYRDGELAGVSFANVYPDGRGALLYVGVVPELRGRGLGAALHRDALTRLRRAGARRYIDITAVDNHAMRRVFERNGCVEDGGSRLWLRRQVPAPAWLDDLSALVDHLRATGHAVDVRDPSGWVRAPMRVAEHTADVDVVWLRDLGLVQIVHTFDVDVAPDASAAMLGAIAAANSRLDVCGFAMDPESRTLRYQASIWLDDRGRLPGFALRRSITTVVRTAARSRPMWTSIAGGDAEPTSWALPWVD